MPERELGIGKHRVDGEEVLVNIVSEDEFARETMQNNQRSYDEGHRDGRRDMIHSFLAWLALAGLATLAAWAYIAATGGK